MIYFFQSNSIACHSQIIFCHSNTKLCTYCAFGFCRLEELVNTIIKDAGGKTYPLFEFTYKDIFCTLDWNYDLKPLTEPYGKVSNHLMEWVRIWLNPELEDVKCHVCSPYMIGILRSFLKLHTAENLEVFVEFIHEKYPALPGLDMTTLIVPYTCGNHWSVYILGDQGFFHMNSLSGYGPHSDITIRTQLAKMWATRSGYEERSSKWQRILSPDCWILPTLPQQNSGWACGFYVIKNIMEFTKALRFKPHTLREVSSDPSHRITRTT